MREKDLIGQSLTGRHLLSRRLAGDLSGSSVLDVGCGAGWFLEHALESGCARAVGVERSAGLVEMVNGRLPAVEIVELDATRDLSPLGVFDLVCAFDFVEHLPPGSEVAFFREAARVLEPDGRLLLSVPFRSLLSCALDPAFYMGHRHYTLARLQALLERAGFEVERAAFAGGIWEQLSVLWLYLFKWVFRREMPFAGWLEARRASEYEMPRDEPGTLAAFATMFVTAVPAAR